MNYPNQKFDEQSVRNAFRQCWSRESSSLWSEQNPACGQCSVTALVIQDHFGGEILKTPVDREWHFYNQINNESYDLTKEQFAVLPEYVDLISNREEAFAHTNQNQYSYLSHKFRQWLGR